MNPVILAAVMLGGVVAHGAHAADKSMEPATNAAEWFMSNDYPAEALAAEAEGTVGISYNVDAMGRVTFCTVTQSSGSVALDETTCRLMKERGRFTPARDAKGKPVAAQGTRRVTWRIPREAGPVIPANALPLRMIFIADLNGEGSPVNCKLSVMAPPGAQLPVDTSTLSCEGSEFFDNGMRIVNADGTPAKGRVQINVETKLLPPVSPK